MAMSRVPRNQIPLGEANNPLEELREIRSMMERSSRFISLSGLSGVFAGVFALIGAGAAYAYLTEPRYYRQVDFYTFFFVDALSVLTLSLAAGVYLTTRQARRKGQKIWDATSQRLLVNLFIPLVTGGIFILALVRWAPVLVAPATLVFYGLALINGSKFTLHDVRYLGFCQIVLGLVCAFYVHYGLFFWAFGFGLLHIADGAAMYYKYERGS